MADPTDTPEDYEGYDEEETDEDPEGITELFTGDENDPDAPGYLGGTAMMRN